MGQMKYPVTAAIRFLKSQGVKYTEHLYTYEDRGGTAVSSRELGISEHVVVKTLIMQTEDDKPLVVLMHGDKKVSTKGLARIVGVKSVRPCDPKVANKHSGYVVGGTSPFGTRKVMPIYIEKSIFDLSEIYVNGGARGFLVCLSPQILMDLPNAIPVSVAIESLSKTF
ncbi:MAG: aminoacyl-tRNA deacylase [Betaproteobacteria bacterium]|nr:aminoacyl-tRNA deacylase [Betaproteobacteria bacterium]MBT6412654.1 aminoacyl-tRNA deacylase [Betaproteobacteria bacterium]HAT52282.1 Cys-tRNA(Pro) deacylase [Betaproteobacteria bacterium]HAU83773.1 Cys-tRNA(Pro) deacylase [Betaproteobacteria bacterium]